MSLLSEIAHIPHESVTVLLLDTTLPSPPLYSALLDVSQQFLDMLFINITQCFVSFQTQEKITERTPLAPNRRWAGGGGRRRGSLLPRLCLIKKRKI